jgi:dihydropteroate synthase
MHMQNNPKNMQKEPFYENVILEIDDYFSKQIEKAKSFGIKDIVLDVGIGFGKTLRT